jgi:chemotaxis protein CheX
MDVRYINPLLESILNVMNTMANLQPRVGKPGLKSDNIARGEVSGIMCMQSSRARASMAISFTTPVICDIVKRILREDINEVNATARDLTGEVTNMVVGGAKNLFLNQGYDFDMSTPNVVSGKDHLIQHQFKGRTILLPFTIEAGNFFIEICCEE